jgi:hypothetical protein
LDHMDSLKRNWSDYNFKLVGTIQPEIDDVGKMREYFPQTKYRNQKGLSLSPNGHGPFCKFRILNNWRFAGVYALTIDGRVIYIGECFDLSSRFNNGYGNISPRNCYEGGQPTNCRINNLIYNSVKSGNKIDLWFLRTDNRMFIEAKLIKTYQPEWNRKGIIVS